MLKKIIYVILGVVVLLVVIGFMLPGKFEITRTVKVNAPAAYSFEEVDQLENWNNWSYWNTLDKTMKITYGEKKSGEGASYSWTGEEVGDGKLLITESIPNKSIKTDLDFMDNGIAKSWYTFEPVGDSTAVTMGFSTEFGMNPFMRLMGATMFESEMDKAFTYNLQKIKELAEGKPKFTANITEEKVQPVSYVGITHKMSPKDPNAVSAQMGKMYTELYTALKKAKVDVNGNPFALFPSYTPESMEMVCALPVAADAKVPAKYKIMQTAGGNAVKAVHTGSYNNLEATHNEINKYVGFKKYEISGAPWEVYVTDPMTEKDTAKWITEIYYPIK
jgi:effector-binding domain-containing protein